MRADIQAFVARHRGWTPNHWLKRPGPHRAWAVDEAALAMVRRELGLAKRLGAFGPMRTRLGLPPDKDLEPWRVATLWRDATVGDDFGLDRLGMLLPAGVVPAGEPLVPETDGVSPWWMNRRPYMPQVVVPAATLLELDRQVVWDEEVAQRCFEAAARDDGRPGWEAWPDVLDALWGNAAREALARWTAELEALASRGSRVMVWEEPEGMLL